MNIEFFEKERDIARKEGNKTKVTVINDMLSYIHKAEMAGKKKIILSERQIDEVLLKYKKMLQESIDTCPANHSNMTIYTEQMKIASEYFPKVIDDRDEITTIILNKASDEGIILTKKNKGIVMKTLVPVLRAQYVDMGVAMEIINELLQ